MRICVVCVHVQDILLTQQWLLTLQASAYTFPAVTASSSAYVASGFTQKGANHSSPTADVFLPETSAHAENATAYEPRQGALLAACTPSLWAVFSTNEGATPIMKQVASMDGWRVVVVAESPAAQPWVWPNITYLTVQQQDSLGYAILQHLPTEGPG